MTPRSDQSAASHSADFAKTWRYKLGLFLIIGGHLVLLAGVLAPFIGAGAGVVGAMVVAGQIMTYSSMVFFGKEGFMAIKNKLVVFAKSTCTAPGGTRILENGWLFYNTEKLVDSSGNEIAI